MKSRKSLERDLCDLWVENQNLSLENYSLNMVNETRKIITNNCLYIT